MDITFKPTPHTEAVDQVAAKPVVSKAVFDQLLPEIKNRVFTVTGIEAANVLQSLRDQVAALPQGENWEDAKAGLAETMSPYLGEEGSQQRATLLLRTHGFQAFQAANWRLAHEDEDTTHLQYLATEDDRVRDTHLALNGIILPKDDPFWSEHYPPWEWNCRCRVRSMNPDMVDEAKADDEKRAPENKLVMEGPALRKLREGTILRDGRAYDVLPPEGKTAYRFHPENLTISLDELKARYDPEVWAAFETLAKSTQIEDGQTLWDWLKEGTTRPISVIAPPKPVEKPVAFKSVAAAIKWADGHMHPDNLPLTETEHDELSEFQDSSARVNRHLVDGTVSGDAAISVEAIDSAIKKSVATRPMTVWKGGRTARWHLVKPGDILSEPAYLSTTLAENMKDFEKKAWIKINVPKGAHVFYMDKINGHEAFGEEAEMVLPRNSRLLIKSVAIKGEIAYIEADLLL